MNGRVVTWRTIGEPPEIALSTICRPARPTSDPENGQTSALDGWMLQLHQRPIPATRRRWNREQQRGHPGRTASHPACPRASPSASRRCRRRRTTCRCSRGSTGAMCSRASAIRSERRWWSRRAGRQSRRGDRRTSAAFDRAAGARLHSDELVACHDRPDLIYRTEVAAVTEFCGDTIDTSVTEVPRLNGDCGDVIGPLSSISTNQY